MQLAALDVVLFFFFQAEDGIRDYKVTGVQTCALPISADYRVVSEIGPDHRKTFVVAVSVAGQVLASGAGANKKEAEQAAARQALERLLGAKELGKEEHGRSDSPRGN